MPAVRKASLRRGGVLLAAGTVKGLFFLSSGPGRRRWDLSGPHFPGLGVYAVAFDFRSGRHRLWAGIQSMHWGAELVWTDDFGQTWTRPETPLVRFPESSGASLQNMRDRVVTELGEVRPHVNVFVNAEAIRFTDGLATPVEDGAEIAILPAISGG